MAFVPLWVPQELDRGKLIVARLCPVQLSELDGCEYIVGETIHGDGKIALMKYS